MPDYTVPQWQTQARSVAISNGLDPAIFSGLIEQESSWNPNAQATGSSAFGFTQLTKGAAADMGVNQYDPMQNLQGGAGYLSNLLNKFGGDYTKALAAYHDGAGAIGLHGGFEYAKSVLDKAKKYFNSTPGEIIQDGIKSLADSNPITAIGASVLGIGGDSCGINPVCYLRQWLEETDFVQRTALYIIGAILIIGGIAFLGMGYKPTDLVRKAIA